MGDLDGWNAEKIGVLVFCPCTLTSIDALLSALSWRMSALSSRLTALRNALDDYVYTMKFANVSNVHKALAQKAHSEEQAAAQSPGKRNQIAFTSSSTRTSQASHSTSSTLHAPAKRQGKEKRETRKFEPYEGGAAHRKARPGTRW
jgi:hypothetical protein